MSNENLPAVVPPQEAGLTFGRTQMDATDFVPPRVKVLQAMSQETVDKQGEVGDFYNTLTGENYGSTLRFIPLTTFKNRVLIVRPERRDEINKALKAAKLTEIGADSAGLQCRSLDMYEGRGVPGILCDDCPLAEWRGDQPPYCTETYNVTAMNELGDLIILSFAKSGAKTGKRLISMMRMRREKPWTSILEATTRMDRNDRGSFAVPQVKATGDRTPDDLLPVAMEWIHELTGRVIDVTPPEDDVDETPEEGTSAF